MQRRLSLAVLSLTALTVATASVAGELSADVCDSPPVQSQKVCAGTYALCISAPCRIIPAYSSKGGERTTSTAAIDATEVLCECVVAWGYSLGAGECDARTPRETADGTFLVSTYSYLETPSRPNLTCPSGIPYANCYGAPCVIDALEPNRAWCSCPLTSGSDNTGGFTTRGGWGCDTASCSETIWQGVTPADNDFANVALGCLLEVEPPVNSCSSASK